MYDNLTRTNLEFAHQEAEKRITNLEKENNKLILGNKSLSEKLINVTKEKLDLQKENAELKEKIKLMNEQEAKDIRSRFPC